MIKKTFLMFSLVFVSLFGMAQQQPQSEILWDNWGVPHIYGQSLEEMYYGFGWSQMQNHGNLVLQLYAEARGEAAKHFGEAYLPSDKKIHMFNVPGHAQTNYSKLDGTTRSYLDAFVKGVNDYAQQNPDKINQAHQGILPITGADVVGHQIRIFNVEFLAILDPFHTSIATPGSNSYALSSKRTDGSAMLLTNPHLQWSGYFTFFEAHLNAPDFEAYGATLVGLPVLAVAFNNNLGWTHTVNTIDAIDRYRLELRDGGYVLDGKIQQFQTRNVDIEVKTTSGTRTEQVQIKSTQHGPVTAPVGDEVYALRHAGFEVYDLFRQYHEMAAATNFDEFQKALQLMALPMFNVVYADKDDNIMYFFAGNVPQHRFGDWSYWTQSIEGTNSRLIWKDYLKYDDLPKVINPETGFVQNANDAPWTSTYPAAIQPEDYPAWVAPELQLGMRPQRAINLILADSSITFEEFVDIKLNTGMEVADRFLDELLQAGQNSQDSIAQDSLVQQALSVLENWDRKTDTASQGAVLFAAWYDKLAARDFQQEWDEENPVSTPSGLKNPSQALTYLQLAAEEVQLLWGSLDVAWGDVNRFKIHHVGVDYPGNGGEEHYGIFRTMYFFPDGTGNKFAVAGDTYVAVTEFADTVRAKVLMSYGNASQPGSEHIGDQTKLLSQKQLRDALLEPEDVMQELKERTPLNFSGN